MNFYFTKYQRIVFRNYSQFYFLFFQIVLKNNYKIWPKYLYHDSLSLDKLMHMDDEYLWILRILSLKNLIFFIKVFCGLIF